MCLGAAANATAKWEQKNTTCGNIEWQMASSLDTTTTGVSKVAVASALAGARRGSGMVGGVVGDVQRAMFL